MPFPVEHRGEVRWRTTARLRGEHLHDAVMHELVTALRGAKGTVTVNGSTVLFTTEPGRVVRQSNILLPIGHGSLAVTLHDDTVVVAYVLNFQPLVVLASVLALMSVSFVTDSAAPLAVRIGVPALIWVFVFGIQYLITIVRFRDFILRVLDRV